MSALLVPALLTLSACGTGGAKTADTGGFELKAIGPAGGFIAAGDIRVVVPAGALAQETFLSILPQTTPLPIHVAAGDPCTYAFLGPLWCCGPVGHDLLAPARLEVDYDDGLIPVGVTEADLVLLLWDNALGAFVVEPHAAHDPASDLFTHTVYSELGHIAVACARARGRRPTASGLARFATWVSRLRARP